MPLELYTFVEKCYDKFVGYFCEPNRGKNRTFSSQMTKFFATQTAWICRALVIY